MHIGNSLNEKSRVIHQHHHNKKVIISHSKLVDFAKNAGISSHSHSIVNTPLPTNEKQILVGNVQKIQTQRH